MLIRVGYDIQFQLLQPTPMLMLLKVHPDRERDLLAPEWIQVQPEVPIYEYFDTFGNRCGRINALPGTLRILKDAVIRDSGLPEPESRYARQHPIEDLPPAVIQFLLASRYCETDELSPIAFQLFGQTPPGWERVHRINSWVFNNVEFGYAYANPKKTARHVYQERRGVCRDFVHLAITFCRAMNIPARYATGYLGDIGVPADPAPMDFSAFYEVYLGGEWHAFDARHNRRRIGRVLMARGRDAADAALTTAFGPANLTKFKVWTHEVSANEAANVVSGAGRSSAR